MVENPLKKSPLSKSACYGSNSFIRECAKRFIELFPIVKIQAIRSHKSSKHSIDITTASLTIHWQG
jgi:hypothetical protein